MHNNPAAANRVATMIATFKWIIIGLIALMGLIGFLVGVASGDEGIFVGFLMLVGAAVYGVVLFVLFGWFEQTLRMLANISQNTSGGGLPPTTAPPAPPYGG